MANEIGETRDLNRYEELVSLARGAQQRAYAPYSRFQVGAAILDEKNEVHLGVNVENAAYPNGSCAEASAISAMVLAGGREIRAIAVVGAGELPCSPCGGCRQRIREFSTKETVVVVAAGGKLATVIPFGELLPQSFGPENLR
jgi:cytidine deaminase